MPIFWTTVASLVKHWEQWGSTPCSIHQCPSNMRHPPNDAGPTLNQHCLNASSLLGWNSKEIHLGSHANHFLYNFDNLLLARREKRYFQGLACLIMNELINDPHPAGRQCAVIEKVLRGWKYDRNQNKANEILRAIPSVNILRYEMHRGLLSSRSCQQGYGRESISSGRYTLFISQGTIIWTHGNPSNNPLTAGYRLY